MNKKIASEIAVGSILLIAAAIGVIFWLQNKNEATSNQEPVTSKNEVQKPSKENSVRCTQEAKLCDDGSYVSRTGPNCEFAACPVADENANWKVYKNERYSFSLKYPDDWEISLSETDGFAKNYFMPPSYFECSKQKESGKLDKFAPCGSALFGVASNPEKLKFEDYYKREFGEEFYRDLKTISVNGKVAYSLIASSAYDGTDSTQFWVPLADGNFFEIGGAYINEEESALTEQVFNSLNFQ